jgi:diguanylate cyclase (GGDEF)-like protein
MKDEDKPREQLITEVATLRRRIDDLLSRLEDERKKVRELAVLNDISSLFYGELDEETTIETIVDKSKELIRSEFSALLLLKDGKVTRFYTSIGDSSPCKIKPTGILEKVFNDGMPVRGREIRDLPGFKGFSHGHPAQIRSVLVVPIVLEKAMLGEIILANRVGAEEFSLGDEDLLVTLSIQAAFALERVRNHQKIAKLATIDGLTGLNNHRTFQERLDIEIERAKRFKQNLSLLMMDLDFFKRLNDTYGHRAGDQVLKKVACRIVEGVRNIDLAARYGGEEFVAILPATSAQGAIVTAERIRNEIMNKAIKIADNDVSITISIGIATYPEDSSARESLIERADTALYAAKESGRNKICCFGDIAGEQEKNGG